MLPFLKHVVGHWFHNMLNLVALKRRFGVLRSRFGVLRSRTRFRRSRFESRFGAVSWVRLNVFSTTCLSRLLRFGFTFWAPQSLEFNFMDNKLLHLSVGWLVWCSKYQPLPCNLILSFFCTFWNCVLSTFWAHIWQHVPHALLRSGVTFWILLVCLVSGYPCRSWSSNLASGVEIVVGLRSGHVLVTFWPRFEAWHQ